MNGSDARPLIRLKFVDFWADFNPRDNFFTRLLESRYRLDHCDSPDFVIVAKNTSNTTACASSTAAKT